MNQVRIIYYIGIGKTFVGNYGYREKTLPFCKAGAVRTIILKSFELSKVILGDIQIFKC